MSNKHVVAASVVARDARTSSEFPTRYRIIRGRGGQLDQGPIAGTFRTMMSRLPQVTATSGDSLPFLTVGRNGSYGLPTQTLIWGVRTALRPYSDLKPYSSPLPPLASTSCPSGSPDRPGAFKIALKT